VSIKLNSHAFVDVQDQVMGQEAMNFVPELHLIKPRPMSRDRLSTSAITTSHEDVVIIGGRFTVSF
jgi:hypothetical protein